ncbi:carboxypeptidase-like regulatory domain-containing protein [Bacteroides sp. OttesenSCG-928-E20]|nr:carboxypeptidase-like regulatory domain-containing protein [Bacteroides sp. OttesenSCG-928-E20]MDL2305879.1 carboxypeptidase-like regulatory domain-containing protein [Bacteroides sp. OttesenSCG-928-D19]
MKKKSFFRSYSAKLALAVLAVSGVLLTGCSKDDGIEIKGPSVTMPEINIPPSDQTYSVVVSVLDAKTMQPVASSVSDGTDSKATTTTNGVVTFSYKTAPNKTYTATPTDSKYNTGTAKLEAAAISNGVAVYPITIYLLKESDPEPQPEETEYKYDLTVKAVDYVSGDPISSATIKVSKITEDASVEMTSLNNLEAGAYLIEASAEGYVSTTVRKVLGKVMGLGELENIKIEMEVGLYKEEEVPPTIDYYKVYGDVKLNDLDLDYTSIKIYNANDRTKVYTNNATSPKFSVDIPEGDFKPVTRALAAGDYTVDLYFEIIDVEGNKFEFTKTFTLTVSGDGIGIASDDLLVKAVIEAVESEGQDEVKTKVIGKDLQLYNETAETVTTSVKFAMLSGTQVIVDATPSQSPIGKLLAAELEKEEYNKTDYTAVSHTIKDIPVPAYTEITEASYDQVFTTVVTTFKLSITIEGGEPTTTELTTGKVTKTTAQVVTVNNLNFKTISMSHNHGIDHGHSHGGGTNAGGGIIEGE